MVLLLVVLVYAASVSGSFGEGCSGRDAYLERCAPPGPSYRAAVVVPGELPAMPELFFPRVPGHRVPGVAR